MRISSRHIILVLVALICLFIGLINYLLFQQNIILVRLLHIEKIGNPLLIYNPILKHFFIGYFSDVMWCIALCLVTVVLSELKYLNTAGKVLTLQLPFTLEAAQYFGIIQGTFDWLDILTYAIIVTAFSLLFKIFKKVRV